ncbi:MAG: hypothetical protein L6R39_005528 [Caloplaca ligustica]|nr:MAG: hypothetical protein L6R39_005528 [Caloplaca ligustica]
MAAALDPIHVKGRELSHHPEFYGNHEEPSLAKAVAEVLGAGQTIDSIKWMEHSAGSAFACITTKSLDGRQKQYFLKCVAVDEAGEAMLLGEYHGMLEIFKCYPSLVPRPYGCGQFLRGGVPTYFLVTDYIEMSDTLPDPCELAKSLANLHRTTISPSGRFGFHTTTWHGKVPQRVQWDSSWVSFFRELLDYALQKDLENSGSWPALEEIASTVLDKVVPRLLGVLESNGRSIRPALIHGDLWEGNIATERGTNRILLIDAAAYYAHCEMEIGMWRCQRHAIHDARFTNAYLEQVPKDEPVDEWDDRNRLYCIKMNLVHSAHHKGAVERKTAFEDMCYLVDKYAPLSSGMLLQEDLSALFPQAVEAAKFH